MKKVNGKYPESEVLANALKQMQEINESLQALIPKKLSFLGGFIISRGSLLMIDFILKAAVILHDKGKIYIDPSLRERVQTKCFRLSHDDYGDNATSVKEINKIKQITEEIIEALKISLEKCDK